MIYIRTCAYNAEKTIRRTIESILSQTVSEFKYYILENGSKDATREIIRDYAEKDSRIVAYYNKVNRCFEENPDFWNLPYMIHEEDYYVILDADDYYECTFLEEMLGFMKESQVEVAACGTILEDENENVIGKSVQSKDIVMKTPEEYDTFFANAHWNMRQVWGKIYSGKVAKYRYEIKTPDWYPKAYGGDTINVLEVLRHANGFGIYAKVLHHYQVSSKSVSYKWTEEREQSDLILDQKTKEFLMEKVGYVSLKNQNFLAGVFLNAVNDTLNVFFHADLSAEKKIELAAKIFTLEPLKSILENAPVAYINEEVWNKINSCRNGFLEWFLQNESILTIREWECVGLFLTSYGNVMSTLIPSKETAKILFQKAPEIVKSLADRKTGTFAKFFLEYLEKMDTERIDITEIQFVQNAAAYLELQDVYIEFSKRYIIKLFEVGWREQAEQELTEWLQMLPEDEDLLNIKEIMGEN